MSSAVRPDFKRRILGLDIADEKNANAYCRWVDRFHDWREMPEDVEITENDLIDFADALEECHSGDLPWTPHTDSYGHSSRVQAVSAVMLWARRVQNVQFTTDAPDLVRGDPDEFDPTILDRDTTQAILEEDCGHPGCLAARTVAYDAVMRAAEVVSLRPDDVDPAEGTVYVRGKKGSQNRHIGVDDRTMTLLVDQIERVNRWFSNPTKLFYTASGAKGWSPNAFCEHFRRKHHDAGAHSFGRHTPIVHRLEDGEDFGSVYLRARHQHPSMTARYAARAGRTAPNSPSGL